MSVTHPLPPLADPESLVKAMGKIHRRLVEDLRTRAVDPRVEPSLREAWAADKKQGRTGESFETYRDAFCDQIGASWVLCTVFARTLEDRGYLPHRLAGPGAIERQTMFRSAFKFLGERDYLLHIFDGVSLLPGAREVFGPGHAALWRLGPTSRALGELLDELRAVENGQLRFTFGKEPGSVDESGASTRYLGDLYQNLNEDVRKRYALLQTPDFVERFLLDNTLNPAIRERGCAVTVLDPACGSGHLLLGAYDRLFGARLRDEPGRPVHETAKLALGQVFGIDLNPYAAAVARFRLLLSYLDKAGITRLQDAPQDMPLQVYVGDSLLAGRRELQKGLGDLFANTDAGFERSPAYSLFNSEADKLLYKTKFDVVVANPPYITEKDAVKRDILRKQYKAAYNQFALSAPFAERIFQLGNPGAYTGQITANSFMKREFGKPLVEQVLPLWDLTGVIDTSGAYIPGHGTPTVILFGRSQKSTGKKIPVVMGIRGEPTPPEDPAQGKAWLSIAEHHHDIGFDNEFISVAEVEQERLGKHPWSIGGGGAAELKELIEARALQRLSELAKSIGRVAHTGADEAYVAPGDALVRHGLKAAQITPFIEGEVLRDWTLYEPVSAVFPYDQEGIRCADDLRDPRIRWLWPYRTSLWLRREPNGTHREIGLTWYEFSRFHPERFHGWNIAFAFVATHNHFVLDRGGKVFKQSAPVIKLHEGAAEDDYLALLGLLNSSTACFWMKQVFFPKGVGDGRKASAAWQDRFEHDATKLRLFPIVNTRQRGIAYAKELDKIAIRRHANDAASLMSKTDCSNADELRYHLNAGRAADHRDFQMMVALQEELDWLCYTLYGIDTVDDAVDIKDVEPLPPTALPWCMRMAAADLAIRHALERGEQPEGIPTDWFTVHGLTPSTTLPDSLLPHTRARIEARLARTAANPSLALIETAKFKRRWEPSDWDAAVKQACEIFLLTRAETFFQSRDPRPLPIRTIAAELHRDLKVRAVAEVLTGSANVDLEMLLADLFQQEAVASATCQVYSDEGIETRRARENVWELQRREDAGEKLDIEPPLKYDPKDFENADTVWRLRGKLDVPKERFIAYPTATPPPGAAGKPGMVFGWAGWDALQKLQAAIELWQEEMGLHGHEVIPRATRAQLEESAPADEKLQRDTLARQKLAPILQTMVDLLPWVKQWHDEDGQTASAFEAYIAEEARKLEMTLEEAHLYRRPVKGALPKSRKATEEKPAKKPRGKKPKSAEGDG